MLPVHTVMEPLGGWLLERSVLPQHTDHAGVMWHGAYIAWLEEARVQALQEVGLAYSELSARGLELPVVELAIRYRQELRHGDRVRLLSMASPRRGVQFPWQSRFLSPDGSIAAEARVALVAVDRSAPRGPRVLRRLPGDLQAAMEALALGPA